MNLWTENTPQKFWQFKSHLSNHHWNEAISNSRKVLGLPDNVGEIEEILEYTLGEKRFGQNRWELPIQVRIYYHIKPYLPKKFTIHLRRLFHRTKQLNQQSCWPIEPRYVNFLWQTALEVMKNSKNNELSMKPFWPDHCDFCLVLTHDVESEIGYKNILNIAELEDKYSFRSCFNFVADLYPDYLGIKEKLKSAGFEVGVHGWRHDGRLFFSRNIFNQRVKQINQYIYSQQMHGFRAPLTHRHAEWMQALNIEYDSTFFDTDPYEPIPGGVMSIYPFFIGKFLELPITLPQDHTLFFVLKHSSIDLWMKKIRWIKQFHGMVLINTHPDYLIDPNIYGKYQELLDKLAQEKEAWHALPTDVTRWWIKRHTQEFPEKDLVTITKDQVSSSLSILLSSCSESYDS